MKLYAWALLMATAIRPGLSDSPSYEGQQAPLMAGNASLEAATCSCYCAIWDLGSGLKHPPCDVYIGEIETDGLTCSKTCEAYEARLKVLTGDPEMRAFPCWWGRATACELGFAIPCNKIPCKTECFDTCPGGKREVQEGL